jgi:hypothetical protein
MTEPQPFACGLTPQEQAAREPRDRALAEQLRHLARPREREAVLAFPQAAAPLVHEFVRDESRCCEFFDFAVEPADDVVRLTVSAPPGAEAMLQALVDAVARPSAPE